MTARRFGLGHIVGLIALAAMVGILGPLTPDGRRVGAVSESPGGRVDMFDAVGRRIGTVMRDCKLIRMYGQEGR